ncbi:hypothetical protein CEXT_776841 [Caerostris extrusa]|uniref:Kazal-like domain-containing protein n=1 Tax=Caerostris extrusa TaxID=172846 RepID=A0AAV4TFF4_CAEEX|nr:hypothetical protein CEXT_776841 [Caerostris extrusa]
MMCTFGSQCLVDESTHRAYCRCAETCSEVFAPVCGNDGVTYSSECQLRLSSCTQQRRIFVLRQGPCEVSVLELTLLSMIKFPTEKNVMINLMGFFLSFVRSPRPMREARLPVWFLLQTIHGWTNSSMRVSEECFHHGKDQNAMCGTDGKNYPNNCELKKASCQQMKKIEVKFEGVCDPCDGVECPTSQICQLDESRHPICRCNSVCNPDFRPVCGSDGRTYTNECTLRVEACKSRKNIRIIYTGECSTGSNPCDNLQCSPYQNCEIDVHGTATCQCDEACEKAVRLVCGSDRQTYPNECEMKREGCLQKNQSSWLTEENVEACITLIFMEEILQKDQQRLYWVDMLRCIFQV